MCVREGRRERGWGQGSQSEISFEHVHVSVKKKKKAFSLLKSNALARPISQMWRAHYVRRMASPEIRMHRATGVDQQLVFTYQSTPRSSRGALYFFKNALATTIQINHFSSPRRTATAADDDSEGVSGVLWGGLGPARRKLFGGVVGGGGGGAGGGDGPPAEALFCSLRIPGNCQGATRTRTQWNVEEYPRTANLCLRKYSSKGPDWLSTLAIV